MRILWLVNIPLPEPAKLMGEESSPFGGWLVNSSKELSTRNELELTILFPKKGVSHYLKVQGQKIQYYAFRPIKDKDINAKSTYELLEEILDEVKPDLVHLFGTEMAHANSMVKLCKAKEIRTVISIQGLVSIISKHMTASLPWKVIYGNTFRNILRRDNVKGLQRILKNRGISEIDAIKNTKNIIGRTSWDKACSTQINPKVSYHHCNEILRDRFYNGKWNYLECEKHTLFVSQAHYPIKGLHYVIEAMPLILRKFPDTKLYVSGRNIIKNDTIYDRLIMSYYAKYISYLIEKNKLTENVIFTGQLDEEGMYNRFLKTHVFVSPSTIENESNSLSEAKMLGVPSVVSYVGGTIDRISHSYDGFLYQHDAPYMMANYICKIFEDESLANNFSENSRNVAHQTHDKQINTDRLVEIYKEIRCQ